MSELEGQSSSHFLALRQFQGLDELRYDGGKELLMLQRLVGSQSLSVQQIASYFASLWSVDSLGYELYVTKRSVHGTSTKLINQQNKRRYMISSGQSSVTQNNFSGLSPFGL
jgi:hypothetical protein